MYIGPWQEFKLARILQLKEKVEREEKEANQLEPQGGKHKAYSVGTNMIGGRGKNQPFNSAYNANQGQISVQNKPYGVAHSDFFQKNKAKHNI